jgi:glycolate oxidase FAD binding subunit
MNALKMKSISDIQACVTENQKIHIIGYGTKSALMTAGSDVTLLSLAGLSGITEYQPEEYTVTAMAGTPLIEIQDALTKNGQYLPFDPLLSKTATIGGTVATNLSGSRRYRYGGIRDFILGTTVVDGQGRTFRCGGKVVKNSAGFDLPKFLVGSLGKYAVMTELTFKIFPEPPAFTTLRLQFESLDDVLSAIYFINQSIFELDALDIEPDDNQWVMLVRITGTKDTLPERTKRFVRVLKTQSALKSSTEFMSDGKPWDSINDLSWASSKKNVIKIVLAPKQIPALENDIQSLDIQRKYSVGGNIAWVATDDLSALSAILEKHQLTGMPILGQADSTIIGKSIDNVLSDRIKHVFDPENKFC